MHKQLRLRILLRKKMKDNATLEEQCPMHPSVPCLLKRQTRPKTEKLLMYWHRTHHCGVFKALGLSDRNVNYSHGRVQ
ncbi:uncharacterized protein LOC119165738 isoform X2 [Rhipicephalus microplus]|uniref:uncharacterized protein LOC119165738 isoform X2 n=1 Tax=Rhipicephalus microplus TaxID=6941 RepID=UPI003F6C0BB9